jgi:hypothetical protein
MKNSSDNPDIIFIKVQVDKELNAYSNKVFFPKKVERANQFLEKFGLPQQVEDDLALQKDNLTALQKALLKFYVQEPTEEQLGQLNDFLSQLFTENREKIRA